MLQTLGLVEIHSPAANALPTTSHCALASRRLGGWPLLEWIVRRLSESEAIDRVCVVVGHDNRLIGQLRSLTPPNVDLFVSKERDALARCAAAAHDYGAQSIVRVCLDNPFVDPVLVDRLVAATRETNADYAGFCFSDGRPLTDTRLGVSAEWCRSAALENAARTARAPADRRHATRYIQSHPDQFRIHLIPAPAQLDRADMRLAIDVEEDWEHAEVIYDALGSDEIDWQSIVGLLDQQPAIRARMAVLNQTQASA